MTEKRCSVCGQTKPITAFFTQARKNGRRHPSARCRTCNYEYARQWKCTPKGKRSVKHSGLQRQYGITLAEYDRLLVAQGGICAICGGTNPDGRQLGVDHDHKTDEVRGLLCHACNVAIGLLKDDTTILESAIRYISRARSSNAVA